MKKRFLVGQVVLIALITFFLGYFVGANKIAWQWKNFKPEIQISSKEPPSEFASLDFTPFWTVWQKIESDYYDKTKIDPQKMLNGAISGALQSLGDPFTVYLPPVQNADFKQGLAGQFSGIGAELGVKGNDIIVIAPLDGSPAKAAGIKAGDIIVKVDSVSTAGWTLTQAVEKIRGEKGTEVVLTIIHRDTTKQVDIRIVRDIITISSVEGWVKKIKDIDVIDYSKFSEEIKEKDADSSIAYVRLSQFGDKTNDDWTSLIVKLSSQIREDQTSKGIILDLRNNPGGYLNDAVFIASEFLDNGSPVVIEDNSISQRTLSVTRRGLLTEIPVVVLINRGSASASEIVAGALRDNKKIPLVGEKSYGKGTIQQAEDLGNGSGLHVTIAKWLTPKGTWVNQEGLTPDVEALLSEKEPDRDIQLEKAILELLK